MRLLHRSALNARNAIALLGLATCLAPACSPKAPEPASLSAQEIQGIQIATDAYVAYRHADCETVFRLTRPEVLGDLQATELRDSLWLLRGFCQEAENDADAARATYRDLIDAAPASFAAADANERLRTLDRLANDAAYAERIAQATQSGRPGISTREPALRSAALYPPLARASGIEGFAVVDFGIDRDGRTIDPIAVAADPPLLFEGTAMRAVRGWEYKAKRSADPAERHAIRIVFRTEAEPVMLEEGPAPTAP
jgi:TonB family protein